VSAEPRLWLALLEERPPGADAVAEVAEGGWLAGWLRRAKPVREARRADPRVLDPQGEAATVSLVLPPRDALVPFDDPAVQGARRAVLADAEPADLVTTLLVDDTHFAGALTARRGPCAEARLRDDPFARVDRARLLHVGPGLLGRVAPPPGPVIERHGSAVPWPGGRFVAV
jgi:hypothetical protein